MRVLVKKLCLFWGSCFGVRFAYRETAIQLGRHLASSGIALVYGGARVGLVGVLADSVLVGGGKAIGLMPRWVVEN
jgi:predicted Rossmann-fold nucleotide-binding protein